MTTPEEETLTNTPRMTWQEVVENDLEHVAFEGSDDVS